MDFSASETVSFRRMHMKIDPTQKPLPISPANTPPSHGEVEGKPGFARILSESMQNKPVAADGNSRLVPSVAAPVIMAQDHAQSSEWRTADGLLDALDAYRNQLIDKKSTLKMIEPYVERMKALFENAQPVLDQSAKENPVQHVLQQTMVHVSKEIERFNMGYYVDE
jgi:hypothetical protein